MRKLFLELSMVLVAFLTVQNTAWAVNMSGISDEEALTLGFWARVTAKPATTTLGTGKVFVSEDEHQVYPVEENYVLTHYAEGFSDIYLASSLINATVNFKVYAKADAGSYFTGWSFTDGYTDLGDGNGSDYVAVQVNPSSKTAKANILDYTVYAAFEKVKIVSYEISGSNTMTPENPTCTQTVTFRAETPGFWALSSTNDAKHFKLPVVTPKAGTAGTWTTSVSEWTNSNSTFYGNYALISVPVTFTAPNGNAAEYGAEVVLETYGGVKMKVYLSARTTGGEGEAVRYDKNDNEVGRGNLTDMIAAAAATDVVKLNADYAEPVNLNKSLTFSLNGYNLSNTLTVSGGNVTVAYSDFGGTANALNVTGGKAVLEGGTFATLTVGASGTVEQKGAVITGAAVNKGTMTTTDGVFQSGLTTTKSLTANGGTFNGAVAINVTGGTATIKRGTINGTQYGVQTDGGAATIEKLAVVRGGTKALNGKKGSLTVNNGKFDNPTDLIAGTVTFNAGYFLNADGTTVLGKQVWRNTGGTESREGYLYFVGDQDAALASNVSVCRIGKAVYASIEDALAYANNHLSEEVIIIMENDYTLKAGYYTVPANATLIIPMSNEQETANPVVPRTSGNIVAPNQFRKLTFESGVNMTVQGTIEVTCTQYGQGEEMGVPGGDFGHLILKPGSRMTLSNGAVLRAWGFVTGDGTTDADGNYLSGEIDARRGSTVREMFQMGDWKGGDISFTMAMEIPGMNPTWRDLTHLFPVYTYFIQNVESPVKYHPGSALICATSVNVAGAINAYANDIKVVGKDGEAAMFLMDEKADAENTWVRKYYDVKNDKQVYEVNSGAKLGSVVIDLGEVPASFFGGSGTMKLMLDSRSFVLPLTSNFKIHLLTGYMSFTQSTSCLPGMEVEVDKEAEVALVNDHTEGVAQGALYLYDADQWSFTSPYNGKTGGYVGNSGKFGKIVRYSATLKGQPTARSVKSPAEIGDAKLIVHGTFRSGKDCSVYTSWSKDLNTMGLAENGTGGASIISTNEDAGTFIFDADAPAYDGVKMDGSGNLTGIGTSVLVNYDHNDYGMGTQYPITIHTVLNKDERVYGFELCTPAKLLNGDGTFVETEGTPAGTSYCYMNDQWTTMQVAEDPCFMKEVIGGVTTYYAKPAEYVAVNATYDDVNKVMVGNADHTFSDKAGSGRLFILMEDCQWWEVEKVANASNLYHCTHKDNDTYYYWDETEGKWMEQRFTITWLNEDGTQIKSYIEEGGEQIEVDYSVPYGTQAEYLGEPPTLEPDLDYVYHFAGWTPELGKVTSNVTYTATYTKEVRKFTVIFLNEGDDEIERQQLAHNAWPVCENMPTRPGQTLIWEPEIISVEGDATYRATWVDKKPQEYAITFYDYDGETKLKPTDDTPYMVAVGETPVAPADPAGKPETNKYTYVFDSWYPAIEAVSENSAKAYKAVYREEAKKYTITFLNEDNSEIESNEYSYGETPVCSATPTKENTQQYTYKFAWDPQIQTVMGDATYKAVFTRTTNQYTITLKSNLTGVCTFTGAGSFDYGKNVDNVVVTFNSDKYRFDGWDDGDENAAHAAFTLTEDITLTANFTAIALEDYELGGTDAKATLTEPKEVKDFILTSNGIDASGQIINANYLDIKGDAIFKLAPADGIPARTWYAVAAPWQVDIRTGVYANGKRLTVGVGFDMIEFDAVAYARDDNGEGNRNIWKYVDENGGIMMPGKLYMVYLASAQPSLEFHMKRGTSIITVKTSVDVTGGTDAKANWNAIANPALFRADLGLAGSSDVLKYDPATGGYTTTDVDNMIVAEPVFAQVAAKQPTVTAFVATTGGGAGMPAYRRAPKSVSEADSRFVIEIARNGQMNDRLIVQTAEDKDNTYVIGQDLAKMGIGSKAAQMWMERYNTNLCKNTAQIENGRAEFPLSIFAPTAGEYTISALAQRGDLTLYLTRDGEAIANLSDGDYTLMLERGTAYQYGLRVSARSPQVATGCDEVVAEGADNAQKVLVNGQIFIIRGEKAYTVDGQLVK